MYAAAPPPLHLAALVKQIPAFEAMQLGPDGRLVREGMPLEMSAYCRRAVAEAVHLVEQFGGSVTVVTMGPASAEDVLREAIAFGAGHGVDTTGVHLCDPAFAGADTLATSDALAAAIRLLETEDGPFDLVLVGRNSVDADTGQVGPQLAHLLDLPFATGVKQLELRGDATEATPLAVVGCEHDDTWVEAHVRLPAILSTAERLIDPCKVKDPDVWAAVDARSIRRLRAVDLGSGPWGAAGSPTSVGELRHEYVGREQRLLDGSVVEQVAEVVEYLADRGVLALTRPDPEGPLLPPLPAVERGAGPLLAVVIEPGREQLSAELLGGAVRLAVERGAGVVAFGPAPLDPRWLAARGASTFVEVRGAESPEDVAAALGGWAGEVQPWAVLAGSTAWGREVAARVAATLGAGLTGDAVGLAVDAGRLLAWKPAFGGTLVAAIHNASAVQLATVRPGLLAPFAPRSRDDEAAPTVEAIEIEPRRRVVIDREVREDNLDALANAEMVIGVGQGVDPDRYGELDGLRTLLEAELAATRKVTDRGWLPRARQLGITGHSIAPRFYLALGLSGKYNHTVGVRSAGTIVAINPDPAAPIFAQADLGIVASWDEVVPELERQIRARLAG